MLPILKTEQSGHQNHCRHRPYRDPPWTSPLPSNGRQYPAAQLAAGFGGRRQGAQHRGGFERSLHACHADLASAVEVGANFTEFGLLGGVPGIKIVMIAELFAIHDAATPSSARRLRRAVRTQVLMVPSGCPILADISDCD